MIRIHLVAGRERALLGGHPWVLSGSIARIDGAPEPGEVVEVRAADGRVLGWGDFDPNAQIRVRMWGEDRPSPTPGDAADGPEARASAEWAWLEHRLREALAARRRNPRLGHSNALRLVHAEADGLGGLTIDRYADWIVVKPSTPAMLRRAERVSTWLAKELGLAGAWLRGDLSDVPGTPDLERTLCGSIPQEPVQIYEGPRKYWLDLRQGQKTGFYLDQRDARDLFADLAGALGPQQRVLDLYAYTGGFSVAALSAGTGPSGSAEGGGGGAAVTAVETSAPARELLARNAPGCEIVGDDVASFLRDTRDRFDLISVDPPPFAKHKRDVERAQRAYRELHTRVFDRASPGAHVLTFTCSHHIDAPLFRRTVAMAVRSAGRRARVLGVLGAPADHPVALHHPEGEYLRGLWIQLDGASLGP